MTQKLTILAIVVLTIGSLVCFGLFIAQSQQADDTANCNGINGRAHYAVIENDRVSPSSINANSCDTLTITNQDDKLRNMAFGQHEQHTAYDGVLEEIILQGQSVTVTLNKSGEFSFHDHHQEEVSGMFVVE